MVEQSPCLVRHARDVQGYVSRSAHRQGRAVQRGVETDWPYAHDTPPRA
jgi:hypothetical protein